MDPTDPANFSTLTIVNDTASTIVVDPCVGMYCDIHRRARTLTPGAKIPETAACDVTGSDMTSWRLETPDGRLVGYIAVGSPRSEHDLTFRVSRASREPDAATPEG